MSLPEGEHTDGVRGRRPNNAHQRGPLDPPSDRGERAGQAEERRPRENSQAGVAERRVQPRWFGPPSGGEKMPSKNQDFELLAGNARTLRFGPVVDKNGKLLDLTACQATWTMARMATADEYIVAKSTSDSTQMQILEGPPGSFASRSRRPLHSPLRSGRRGS